MPSLSSLSTIANRFAQLRASLNKVPTRFVGIDIGVRGITVASMGISADQKSPRSHSAWLKWQSLTRINLAIDPTATPSIDWIDRTIHALSDQLPRVIDGELNLAFVSVPSTWVHYQVVQGRNLPACQQQCDQIFQNSIFKSPAHQTHWPVVGLEHGWPNQDDQYVVASTARETVVRIAEAISKVGYDVHSVLPHGAALVHSAFALTSVDAQCVVMLNRDGGLVAMNHNSIQSGKKHYLKGGCGLSRSLPAIPSEILQTIGDGDLQLDDLQPWLADIASEISATMAYSQRANMCDDGGETLLICGEVAAVPGIDVALATLTNRPVATWRYRGQSRPYLANNLSQIENSDANFAVSLSLAHQAVMAQNACFGNRETA
ncbi:MAG: hypothetical protein WBD20_15885 [Pirellulaceae bacterium]